MKLPKRLIKKATQLLVIAITLSMTFPPHAAQTGSSIGALPDQRPAEKPGISEDRAVFNSLDNQGGPDMFGYSFKDNVAPDTATYGWIELRGNPDAVWISNWTGYDDACAASTYPIGFDFPFYGQAYSEFTITSNAQIEFGPCYSYSYYSCLPNTTNPPSIFPFQHDLHLQRGGDATGNSVVGYLNFATFTVIEFDSIGYYSGTYTGSSLKFEVILYNSGRIKIQYNNMVYAGGAGMGTVGVQNAYGESSLQYRCHNQANSVMPLNNGLAIWVVMPNEIPNQSIQGQVHHAGSPHPVLSGVQVWATGGTDTVLTDALGHYVLPLEPGTYTVNFRHSAHCDSVVSSVVVAAGSNVQLDVALFSPSIMLSISSLTFVAQIADSQRQRFAIRNPTGGCPLTYRLADTVHWLSFRPVTNTVDPGQTDSVTATLYALEIPPGEYQTTLQVICNAPDSPLLIHVDLVLLDAPDGSSELPTAYALHPNYPNPFNPTTLLPFDVPQQSQVELLVYNVMGREVARPVSGNYAAGRYQVTFDARGLPSGLYLVKMTAGNFTSMGKMMLLK